MVFSKFPLFIFNFIFLKLLAVISFSAYIVSLVFLNVQTVSPYSVNLFTHLSSLLIVRSRSNSSGCNTPSSAHISFYTYLFLHNCGELFIFNLLLILVSLSYKLASKLVHRNLNPV